jgi:hypothetical protein
MFDFAKWFRKTFRTDPRLSRRPGGPKPRRPNRLRPHLEGLEDRFVPSTLYIDQSGTTIYSGGQSVEIRSNGTGYTFSASEPINVVGSGAVFAQGNGTNTVTTAFGSFLQVDSVQNIQLDSNYTQVSITDNSQVGEVITLGDSATQTLQGILAPVDINTPAGDASLNIMDTGDKGTHQSATLGSGSLTNMAPAAISWSPSGLAQLYLDASGNVEDIFTVKSTGPFPTYLLPGNSSEVDVQSTSGSLTVYGDSTAVYVGSNAPFGGGTLAGIHGRVDAFQLPSRGPVYLSIDDSGDTTGRSAMISRDSFGLDELTGLAPATIRWDPAALDPSAASALTLYGGGGGNNFTIQNLDGSYTTTLNAGAGSNAVNVLGTTGNLVLTSGGNDTVTIGNNGSLANILGPINISKSGGSTFLGVNDSADATGQRASLANGSLTWTNYAAPVTWESGAVTALTIWGGSGANTFNVQSTEAATPVTLNAGVGGDSINVGDAANPLDGIQGALFVNGQRNTNLTFNDSSGNPGAAANRTYTYYLAQNSLSRTGTAQVSFSSMASVNLDTANAGSTGDDVIGVLSTAAGTSYEVNAGTGYNDFIVHDNNYTLNGIQGKLYLHGAGGTLPNDDFVDLYDVDTTTHHTFVLTGDGTSNGGFVQRDGVTNIHYDGLDAYAVLQTAGSIGATVNVQSEAANLFTVIMAGSPDKVTLGNASHTMAGILGDIRVQAIQGQKPTVTLDDSQDPNARNITMSTNPSYGYQITGLFPPSSVGRGRIWLLDTAMQVTLKTGAGSTSTNDVFQVNDLTDAPVLKIDAGNGSNTLVGPNQASTWNITGANSGKLGPISFSNIENLVGGSASDVFKVGPKGSLSGSLNGGGGGDWLDYSAFPVGSSVTVNLVTGAATGVAGGVRNIQNVRGGAGNNTLTGNGGNILIGGAGTNHLVDVYAGSSASGRSLLIGGTGSSTLTAGAAGDILIAGTTNYDSNYAALQSILAEWQSADDYVTRFKRIEGQQSGGLNGSNKLVWGTTVKDTDGASVLNGGPAGAGLDWFFANYLGGNDTIHNFDSPGDEYIDNAI